MVKDIIDGIKSTEARADGIIQDAMKEKAGIIARAREDSRKIADDAEARGKDIVKAALERAREEAARKVEEIAEREAGDVEAVRRDATQRLDQAVDIIIEKMTG